MPVQGVDPPYVGLRRNALVLAAAVAVASFLVSGTASAVTQPPLPKVVSAVTTASAGRLDNIALTFAHQPSSRQREAVTVVVHGYTVLSRAFVPKKRQLLLSVQQRRLNPGSRPLIELHYGGLQTSVRPQETASVTFNCMDASESDRAAVLAELGAAGVTWARINVDWPGLEPSRGVYSPATLASLDDCIAKAQSNGIKPLLIVGRTPAWARSGAATFSPPTNPQDYADALAYLASRYRGEVGAWEIWNEENTRFFWQGNVAQYVQLLQASYLSVKKADPSALVVFGGTYGNDADWVRASYAAGAKGYFDVMATHPYPGGPNDLKVANALQSAAAVHQVMVANGDAKPIWFTESGWSSPNSVSQAQQATALTQELDYTGANLPYVSNVFWFEAKNEVSSVTPGSWQGGLSLLGPDGQSRPAFAALKSWIQTG